MDQWPDGTPYNKATEVALVGTRVGPKAHPRTVSGRPAQQGTRQLPVVLSEGHAAAILHFGRLRAPITAMVLAGIIKVEQIENSTVARRGWCANMPGGRGDRKIGRHP
jgi:hypothetical protein